MFFRQVLHDDLGCASYVVACGGVAAVIDPKWDITDYLELAEEHGFAVRHILETHNHADHVSGHGRLAEATGATIHVSAEAEVEYLHEPLADGDVVAFGNVRITALATPGHRPEHMAFLVTDMGRGAESWLAVTGDSLFVGDLARPDLAVDPEEGAHALFGSLRRLLALDDFAEVWPGHIGGSLCGGAGMSQKPGSTIGFERRYNRLAKMDDEGDFVRALTSHLAAQPPNFKRVVEMNRGRLLIEAAAIEPHAPARVKQLLEEGATLIDGRATREFDGEHVPGSINVTMARSAVGTRAAWVVDPAGDVVVTAASDADALRLGRLLEAVGFRSIRGFLGGGVTAWRQAGMETDETRAIDPAGLADHIRADDVIVLDVRDDDEWVEGHVAGSIHVPYMRLGDGVPAELAANGKPIAVACSTGNRSAIAASLLARAGVNNLIHVTDGGVAELAAEGIELVGGTG